MNSDEQLYIQRHTVYAHILSDAKAAEAIAFENQFSADSVRGRLSKGNTAQANFALAKQASLDLPKEPIGTKRQEHVIELSEGKFYGQKVMHEVRGEEIAVATLADPHLPYTRWDAVELAMMILQDIKKLAYVTVGHDLIDNDGYGRWEDNRPAAGKMWSSDVSNIRKAEAAWYRMITGTVPQAQMLEVMGNHDVWYFNHLRTNEPQSSEKILADYMEWKQEQGVLQFSSGKERSIELSPNLILWHGQFVSKLSTTNAKNTIEQFMRGGIAKSVIVGHTHRPAVIAGHNIGYAGVNFYNAPCLSRLESIPYMKRDPNGWELGLNVNFFVPNTREERGYNIIFKERGSYLIANFNDREYSVKLDRTVAK
jgi:predicted phosphodiesterase